MIINKRICNKCKKEYKIFPIIIYGYPFCTTCYKYASEEEMQLLAKHIDKVTLEDEEAIIKINGLIMITVSKK